MNISARRAVALAITHGRARVALDRIAKKRQHPEPSPDEQRLALEIARMITSGEIHAARLHLDRDKTLVADPEHKAIRPEDVRRGD